MEAFGHTSSPYGLVAKLLYGTGLRLVLCKGSLARGGCSAELTKCFSSQTFRHSFLKH